MRQVPVAVCVARFWAQPPKYIYIYVDMHIYIYIYICTSNLCILILWTLSDRMASKADSAASFSAVSASTYCAAVKELNLKSHKIDMQQIILFLTLNYTILDIKYIKRFVDYGNLN